MGIIQSSINSVLSGTARLVQHNRQIAATEQIAKQKEEDKADKRARQEAKDARVEQHMKDLNERNVRTNETRLQISQNNLERTKIAAEVSAGNNKSQEKRFKSKIKIAQAEQAKEEAKLGTQKEKTKQKKLSTQEAAARAIQSLMDQAESKQLKNDALRDAKPERSTI